MTRILSKLSADARVHFLSKVVDDDFNWKKRRPENNDALWDLFDIEMTDLERRRQIN